jgi:hypothetical protein
VRVGGQSLEAGATVRGRGFGDDGRGWNLDPFAGLFDIFLLRFVEEFKIHSGPEEA